MVSDHARRAREIPPPLTFIYPLQGADLGHPGIVLSRKESGHLTVESVSFLRTRLHRRGSAHQRPLIGPHHKLVLVSVTTLTT